MGKATDSKKILVIEDNDDVRNVVVIYLRSKGYQVVEAVNGEIGLELSLSAGVDLVLLDILLPRMDGIEVLKKMRAAPGGDQLPVVMMSAVLQTRDIQNETATLNVAAFLQKPFQVRTLVEKIETALAQQDALKNAEVASPSPKHRRYTVRSTLPVSSPTSVCDDGLVTPVYEPLPSRGQLSSYSIGAILHGCFVESLTGRLRVATGTTEKRFYVQNGYPVYAESSIPEETLGAYLVAKGKISFAQHKEIIGEVAGTGKQYGELLLKRGLMSPHELFAELESHLTAKVVSTFSWFDGQFLFEPGDGWKDEITVVRMKTGRIILDGIAKAWSSSRIVNLNLFGRDSVPVYLEDGHYTDRDLALNTFEARVVHQLNRGLTVGEITTMVGDEHRAIKVLYGLYVMGCVGFAKRRGRTSVPPAAWTSSAYEHQRRRGRGGDLSSQYLSEYLKLRTVDYFRLLGVSSDATADQIAKAYRTMSKRYHPNNLADVQDPDVREKVKELGLRVHNAYQTLSNPAGRAAYVQKLNASQTSGSTLLASRTGTGRQEIGTLGDEAELIFEKGFSALRDGRYDEAVTWLGEAEKSGDKVKYKAYRAWAQALSSPRLCPHVEIELRQLARDHGQEALLPYLLGNLYLRMKKNDEARAQFERALQIDPQHIDSTRQLRILRMRQTESSGLFDLLKMKR